MDSAAKAQARPALTLLPHNHDSLELYLRDIKKAKNLTLAEEAALSIRIQAGDKRAVNVLVQANLKFVVAVCRNYRYQGMSLGDLINEGNLGMVRAAQRFDGGMKFKFISYAVWWVRQAILTALAEQSRVLKLSTGKVGVIARMGKASQRLEQKLGRAPSMLEVAEHLGISEMEINECLQLASSPMSLTKPVNGEGEGSMEDMLEDIEAEAPDRAVMLGISGKNLVDALGTLVDQEAEVLKLYYGIGRESSETLAEIADRYGVTRERVRQIKAKALERLRHPSRLAKLDRFGT